MDATLQGQRGPLRLDTATVRAGGQAFVYRAQAPWGEAVAVKIAREPKMNPWMERERDTLATLTADNSEWLVGLLDHGAASDGRIFMVLPWFEQTLRDWLASEPPLRDRFQALAQACEAVYRLHHSSDKVTSIRLHRDIKPANLLIRGRPDGSLQVVLADLGGVKHAGMLSEDSQTGLYTPNFAPPEQALPIERAPDPSVDVHALGVTIFHAITGMPPNAVSVRRACYTEQSHALMKLFERRKKLTPAQAETFNQLRALPLRDLLDLEHMEALSGSDEVRLRNHLRDHLIDLVPDPNETADQMMAHLRKPLRRALAPNPDDRDQDARRLLTACTLCAELLPAAEPTAPTSVPTSTSTPAPAPEPTLDALLSEPDEPPPPHRRWRAGIPLLGLMAAVFAGALVVPQLLDASSAPTPALAPAPAEQPKLASEAAPKPPPVEPEAAPTLIQTPPPRPAPTPEPAAEPKQEPTPEPEAEPPPPAPTEPPRLRVMFQDPNTPAGRAQVYAPGSSVPHTRSFSLGEGSARYTAVKPSDGSVRCEVGVSVSPRDGTRWSVDIDQKTLTVAGGETIKVACTSGCACDPT